MPIRKELDILYKLPTFNISEFATSRYLQLPLTDSLSNYSQEIDKKEF
ncbi:MAG: hypothetical protein ACJA01_003598 [Saprospiraceae bacterium]|jgi:hypothetical protein